MTPVPKNLSRQQALAWRRAVARGASTVRGAAVAAAGGVGMYRADSDTPQGPFKDFPSPANSLDRHERGLS